MYIAWGIIKKPKVQIPAENIPQPGQGFKNGSPKLLTALRKMLYSPGKNATDQSKNAPYIEYEMET
ncbi:MAG: hypothetical protein GYA24_14475 [Candidatus Lokiarchaeota archaeon]|nr:hypothetical protein [Candidatus Lokiarchaeota archaeon]